MLQDLVATLVLKAISSFIISSLLNFVNNQSVTDPHNVFCLLFSFLFVSYVAFNIFPFVTNYLDNTETFVSFWPLKNHLIISLLEQKTKNIKMQVAVNWPSF